MKTLLRYAGGKTRGIKFITPFVKGYDEIYSPFIGGGSLEVHWASLGKKYMVLISLTYWLTFGECY
jgi:site-specific DNA-adenine methylase